MTAAFQEAAEAKITFRDIRFQSLVKFQTPLKSINIFLIGKNIFSFNIY